MLSTSCIYGPLHTEQKQNQHKLYVNRYSDSWSGPKLLVIHGPRELDRDQRLATDRGDVWDQERWQDLFKPLSPGDVALVTPEVTLSDTFYLFSVHFSPKRHAYFHKAGSDSPSSSCELRASKNLCADTRIWMTFPRCPATDTES